jgi:hypothetical protein
MPIVFCDAAPAHDHTFLVAAHKPRTFATCVRAPSSVPSVQDAELYGIFHTLRQMILRKHTHVCIVTDNAAAYFTVVTGRCSAQHRTRLVLLRRINRLCVRSGVQLQLALCRSAHNPADQFSRIHANHALVTYPLAAILPHRLKVTHASPSLPRFWWTSRFPCGDREPVEPCCAV